MGLLWGCRGPGLFLHLYPVSQLLKMETDKLVLLVNGTFLEPGDVSPPLALPVMSHQELQLCQHIRSMATSIQVCTSGS